MHPPSLNIDYLGKQQRFLPVLAGAMFSHWRCLLESQGKSREDFTESMQARCRIGSLPTALVAFEGDSVLGTAALKPQDLDIRPNLTPCSAVCLCCRSTEATESPPRWSPS